jgi:penicillin-binding protein-related factor A (putative recombinase)
MDIRQKPYDAIMTYKWIDAKIEFKQSDNKRKVDLLKMLLPHQYRWLKQVQQNKWLALVIYYNTYCHRYRIKEFNERELFLTIE